jgi:predicted nucleotidyltransferase
MFKELNILKVFFESPNKEFNVREIARILKIAPATASSKLKNFANEGLLKEKRERNLLIYKSNLEDERYKDIKIYYTIRKIKESGLIEELNKFYMKPTIILFGSASFGLDTEDSDIDLVVLSEKDEEFTKVDKYEKSMNRRLQLFIIRKVEDLKNEHLINNVLNGIIIQGGLKWI